jgi:hypothetical protein
MTTCPSAAAWDKTAHSRKPCGRRRRRRTRGVADVVAAFGAVGKDDREKLFVAVRVHLSPEGHALAVETVLKAIGPVP